MNLSMYTVITIQCLNSISQINPKTKTLFSVYSSATPVILKQGQGHQAWYKLVDSIFFNTELKAIDSVVSGKKPTLKSLLNQQTH